MRMRLTLLCTVAFILFPAPRERGHPASPGSSAGILPAPRPQASCLPVPPQITNAQTEHEDAVPALPGSPLATFEELRTLMIRSSHELDAAEHRVAQAEARLAGSRLWPNPNLSYERSTDFLFGHEGEGAHSVAFTQPIELGGKRAKRARVAETEVEVSKAELKDLERRLTGRLRLLYARAIAASSRHQVVEKLVSENAELERVMNVRLKAGDASRLESTLLAAETRRLKLQAMRTSGEEAGRMIELRNLAGLASDARVVLGPEPEYAVRTALPVTEEAVAAGFQRRPDLQAARLKEESADRAIVLTRAGRIPNLNPFLGFNRDTNILKGLLNEPSPFVDRSNELVFGVSLELPVFSRRQGEIAESLALRQQARAEREAVEREARLEISSALQRVASAQGALDLATTELLSEQQEAVRILQLSYELGNTGLTDLLTQRRLLTETELTLVDLREELWLAQAELETAMGR